MHQTFKPTLTNNNFWGLSYWEGNLSYGNRQQIQNYLSSIGNLLSFHLKNCIFIVVFSEFIDFVCNFLQRQKAARFGTHTNGCNQQLMLVLLVSWWVLLWGTLHRRGSVPFQWNCMGRWPCRCGGRGHQEGKSRSENHVKIREASTETVNISFFKKRMVTSKCNWKATRCLLSFPN